MCDSLSGAAQLPPKVDARAAWAAFETLSKNSWSIRAASGGPDLIDVAFDSEFLGYLDDPARDYQSQARQYVALRILEAASDLNDHPHRRLKLDDIDPGALSGVFGRARAGILSRIRVDLTRRFDEATPDWEAAVVRELELLDEVSRAQLPSYLGLDQLVSLKAVLRAVKYVFSPGWTVRVDEGTAAVTMDWRLKEVLSKRTTEDERVRNLVARALLRLMNIHGHKGLAVSREWLRAELDQKIATHGPWALIDLVIEEDRSRFGLTVPDGLSAETLDLIDRQNDRCARTLLPSVEMSGSE